MQKFQTLEGGPTASLKQGARDDRLVAASNNHPKSSIKVCRSRLKNQLCEQDFHNY